MKIILFKIIIFPFVLIFIFLFFYFSKPANNSVSIGAYYFDGWTNINSGAITKKLTDSFIDRKPKWGWNTSTQDILNQQIKLAADNGLQFFTFCWYHPDSLHPTKQLLNNALSLYLKSSYSNRLKFNIIICNHEGFRIYPKDWDTVSKIWIKLFKNPQYLRVNNKPLLIIFSPLGLLINFGSVSAVNQAFNRLRNFAKSQGLSGISIAACVEPNKSILNELQDCGYDLFTGYNYHDAGFKGNQQLIPINNLISSSVKIWNEFQSFTSLPYIPVATLNWDPRPWAVPGSIYENSPRYLGFSSESVYNSIIALKQWIINNPSITTNERIGFVYAWNEYGEGSWLTPSRLDTLNLLKGLFKGLSHH